MLSLSFPPISFVMAWLRRFVRKREGGALLLCGALCATPLAIAAPWQWLDNNGRNVFSDHPPPADVPEKNVLKVPRDMQQQAASAPSAAASDSAPPPQPRSSEPTQLKLPARNPQLEARRKQAEEAEATRRKFEEEQSAKVQAENCTRARRSLNTLNSGSRVRQTNAKGEIEIMDDETHTRETRRLATIADSNCS